MNKQKILEKARNRCIDYIIKQSPIIIYRLKQLQNNELEPIWIKSLMLNLDTLDANLDEIRDCQTRLGALK